MSESNLESIKMIDVDSDKKSFRVRRAAYKSQEIFELEQKQIFEKVWLYIGHGSELKKNGDYKTRRLANRDLIFMRDKQGGVVVFYNSCSHRGAKLCRETSGNTRNIVCPYHGWVFNTEGKLLSLKNETGFSEDLNKDCHLDLVKVARLEQYRNFYFINYNPKAISLHDYLAGARDVIDAICDQADTDDEMIILPGEQSYTVRANYKYLAENSYDGYHVEATHASYLDYLRDAAKGTPAESKFDDILSSYATAGQVRGLGNGHAVLESYVPSGRAVAQWTPAMGAQFKEPIEAKKRALVERFGQERADYIGETQKNLVIFPNLVINDIMAVTVRYIEPEGPKFLRVNSWALGPADENEQLRAARLDAYVSFLGPAGFGSPDDIEMLELCQQGLEHTPNEWNELSKGSFTDGDGDARTLIGGPQDEVQLRAYWTQWDRLMRGVDTLEE
ncbi:p-cumate dioxygenase large subunit (CmtAb) [Pseudomonas brassicacearum]|nr:p-cumate dioxygenase large subunit (CmtAb) [Pseudomonas brassicacearum]